MTVPSRWVALFRGINVGRAKRIAMADLRSLLSELGFGDVRTLLNSGNAVFTATESSPGELEIAIATAVEERLGVAARVLVRSQAELEEIVDENELAEAADDPSRLLVAFAGDPTRLPALSSLEKRDWGAERLLVGARAVYLWCPDGILAAELPGAVGEALAEDVTSRNWRTVLRIRDALEAG